MFIFDLDGTLVDTLEDLSDAMNFALAQLKQPCHSLQACRKMIGNGVRTFVQRALPSESQHLIGEALELLRSRYRGNYLRKTKLYDDIYEIVTQLRQSGVGLTVLTNKDHDVAEKIIQHFWGEGIFESVLGSPDGRAIKPASEQTERFFCSMKAVSEELVLIGDSEVDLETAKIAKIRSVGAAWGFRGREVLEKLNPDSIIDYPSEIFNLLT